MKISDEVLTVLSTLEITNSQGPLAAWRSVVRIPGKLDRKLYADVNTVLEACGGKWSRKAKAHVFEDRDAGPTIEDVIMFGEVTTDADLGFFETPAELARQLVEMADVQPMDVVLEPSAGKGSIVEAILARGANVECVERDNDRRRGLEARRQSIHDWTEGVYIIGALDFMMFEPEAPYDRVVMNPPFRKVGLGDHLDHVQHAFEMLVPDGVLVSVLPSGVLFRTDKRHTKFREWCKEHGTITPLPEGSFKSSGTDVNTCVVRLVR